MQTHARFFSFLVFSAVVLGAAAAHGYDSVGPPKPQSLQRLEAGSPETSVGYRRYKGMRDAGIVLSVVGGLAVIGGIIVMVSAANDPCLDEDYDDDESSDANFAGYGCAMGTAGEMIIGISVLSGGLFLAIPGVILAAVGGNKMVRYSGGLRWQGLAVRAHPERGSVGLTATFSF